MQDIMINSWLKNIGPGPLVAAAFIGPGTVTVCTLAGVEFGYDLLWAMVLSIGATIVLQGMAARMGIVTQKGLSELIRQELTIPVLKWTAIVLILAAIFIGNAAYEAGNISGGVLGLEAIFGDFNIPLGAKDNSINGYSLLIGMIAFTLLYFGNYKIIERAMVGLVVLMSLAFLCTAILTKPDIIAIVRGMFVPKFPEESTLRIISLVGTTVVPYNLFLHAALVKEKWKTKTDLQYAKRDTIIAVILGGLVSIAIIIAAAAANLSEVKNASDLAKGLTPLFGLNATYFLAIGLFAAGITSAITAPLAAAFVVNGCLNWKESINTTKFRRVWMVILLLGIVFSSFGFKSIAIINFAQVANGILLPVIAGFLLWIMNKKNILGNYRNSLLQNILGFTILAFTIVLGAKSILKVFNSL